MSHTFATLQVSQVAYDEIASTLRAAGYGDAFIEIGESFPAIDMHGIGLTREPESHAPSPGDQELFQAIEAFRTALPGWWFSIGECSVSCHASCGPDRQWQDKALLGDPIFDEGFHADLTQPSTLAEALREAMREGLEARTKAVSNKGIAE